MGGAKLRGYSSLLISTMDPNTTARNSLGRDQYHRDNVSRRMPAILAHSDSDFAPSALACLDALIIYCVPLPYFETIVAYFAKHCHKKEVNMLTIIAILLLIIALSLPEGRLIISGLIAGTTWLLFFGLGLFAITVLMVTTLNLLA